MEKEENWIVKQFSIELKLQRKIKAISKVNWKQKFKYLIII